MADKEYIERGALLFDLSTGFFPQSMDYTNAVSIAKRFIKDAPTADVVEVRHGFWKPLGRDDNGMLIVGCTRCNRKQFGMPNYCPNCGAKMDGKGEG